MSTTIKRKEFGKKSTRFDYLLAQYKPGNILDIGNVGGVGNNRDYSNSRYFKFVETVKDSTVYGFDLPEARSDLFQNQKYGNIENGLPYENDFFDTVYMGEILEHFFNFRDALSEVHRILKTDGILILDTPNVYSTSRYIRYLCGWESIGNPTHTVLFSPASVKSMLKLNKFELIDISDDKKSMLQILKGTGSHLLATARPV